MAKRFSPDYLTDGLQ